MSSLIVVSIPARKTGRQMSEVKAKSLELLQKKVQAENKEGKFALGGVIRDKEGNYVVIMA